MSTKKELPISYNTEMVQAILKGRKSMTRRPVKPQPQWAYPGNNIRGHVVHKSFDSFIATVGFGASCEQWNFGKCPYGEIGDIQWVRESFSMGTIEGETVCAYKASTGKDGEFDFIAQDGSILGLKVDKWEPESNMPEEAARIWLEVTDVRLERLRDITEEDAIAEGIYREFNTPHTAPFYKHYLRGGHTILPVESFQSLWQSIYGPEAWENNWWVWVVSYKVLSTTGKPSFLNI